MMTIFRGIDIWQAVVGVFAVVFYAYGQGDSAKTTGPLRVHPENPRYFSARDRGIYVAVKLF